jgi:hypothetical protein
MQAEPAEEIVGFGCAFIRIRAVRARKTASRIKHFGQAKQISISDGMQNLTSITKQGIKKSSE